jgi:hypothetical protein
MTGRNGASRTTPVYLVVPELAEMVAASLRRDADAQAAAAADTDRVALTGPLVSLLRRCAAQTDAYAQPEDTP